MNAFIASVGTAVPRYSLSQEEAGAHLVAAYRERLRKQSIEVVGKVFRHPGIRRRYFAIDRPEQLFGETPDERAGRFLRAATELSEEAARRAMDEAGLRAQDIGGIVVNTCTGYHCPGLSGYLAERLELSPTIPAYDLVGSGCGGALPNLSLARSLLGTGAGEAVLSISVEICSATFQMGDDRSLIISNALFGDGAAAAVVRSSGGRLQLLDAVGRSLPRYRDHIRFVYRNGALHNHLSKELPSLAASAVRAEIGALLRKNGLARQDIAHWAFHPGGSSILDAVQKELELDDASLAVSRGVLERYGNMSSPTVWFVMKDHLQAGMEPGELSLMVAFGAGFSLYACLLRSV